MSFIKKTYENVKNFILEKVFSNDDSGENIVDYANFGKQLRNEIKAMFKISQAITVCMLITVISVISLEFYHHMPGDKLAYLPFSEEGDLSSGQRLGQTIANALIVIAIIVVMTFFLVLLVKYHFYKIIHGWLIFSTTVIFSFLFALFIFNVISSFNIAFDYLTFSIFIYNILIVSLISVHWKAPIISQQICLQWLSAILALLLNKNLPDWTVWTVLAAAAIYDIFAVLCPFGPLSMLVNLLHERNEPAMQGLLYTASMAWRNKYDHLNNEEQINNSNEEVNQQSIDVDNLVQTNNDRNNPTSESETTEGKKNLEEIDLQHIDKSTKSCSSETEETPKNDLSALIVNEAVVESANNETIDRSCNNQPEDKDHVIQLGLGDFVFYSVLVARAASTGDLNATFNCIVFINIGLLGTLVVHSIAKKALPALPFSIAFGIISYFGTHFAITPLYSELVNNLTFI